MKIKYSAIVTAESALKAVENDGYALRYVKDQTEAVCLKAVGRDGLALQYVMDHALFKKIAAKFSIEIKE
jgi:hypothetical protein